MRENCHSAQWFGSNSAVTVRYSLENRWSHLKIRFTTEPGLPRSAELVCREGQKRSALPAGAETQERGVVLPGQRSRQGLGRDRSATQPAVVVHQDVVRHVVVHLRDA